LRQTLLSVLDNKACFFGDKKQVLKPVENAFIASLNRAGNFSYQNFLQDFLDFLINSGYN
jgi:hypothetical protein